MKKTWGILGLGWLGQALRDELVHRGVDAWGTHREDFDFEVDPFPTKACDVLFLNTPPLRAMKPGEFIAKAAGTSAKRVIFISSTSVYGDSGRMTEKSSPRPRGDSGQWLVAVEDGLRAKFGKHLTLVRPGGLIGGDRHPVFPLSRLGKEIIDAPINLIHREDLIRIILAAETAQTPLVNAVAPHHPLKSVYYNEWAKRLKLAPIAVSPHEPSDRVIDSDILAGLAVTWSCANLDRL